MNMAQIFDSNSAVIVDLNIFNMPMIKEYSEVDKFQDPQKFVEPGIA